MENKISQFISDAARWASKGFPIANKEIIESRYSICKECDKWNSNGFGGTGKCTACGCSTKAKLVLGSSQCPLGKW
jgi:hypothetical protein